MNKYKNLFKSGNIFLRLLAYNEDFYYSLGNLLKKWPSPYSSKPLGFFFNCKNYQEVKKKNSIAYSQRLKFITTLNRKKLSGFYQDINNLTIKYNLGEEWFKTITDYIISNWLSPPIYNFDIKTTGENSEKRVVLVLNPDTSIEDIKEGWWWVNKRQKESWPNFKKGKNFTKKSLGNLLIAIRDSEERLMKGKEEFDELGRRRYKTYDLDLVSKIWENAEDGSKEADRKKVSNLRQIRRRFKQKIL